MRKAILAAALLAVAACGNDIQQPQTQTHTLSPEGQANARLCEAREEFAESIMSARQSGMSKSDIQNVLKESSITSRPVYQGYISDAFRHPLYYSGAERDDAISKFGFDAYIQCVRDLYA